MKSKIDSDEIINLTRRDFLATSASGIGTLALASLFAENGLLAAEARRGPAAIPGAAGSG